MKEARFPSGKRPSNLLDANGLWDYALKILGIRALSAGELRTKLSRKAAQAADIDGIMARLREYRFIDDGKFAESFAESRRDSQGFGKFRVMRDLQQRKVGRTEAEKAVAHAFDGTDETKLIEQFLERKFRKVNLSEYLKEEKHLASAYRRLRYAGFSASASAKVLKRYSERADELQDESE